MPETARLSFVNARHPMPPRGRLRPTRSDPSTTEPFPTAQGIAVRPLVLGNHGLDGVQDVHTEIFPTSMLLPAVDVNHIHASMTDRAGGGGRQQGQPRPVICGESAPDVLTSSAGVSFASVSSISFAASAAVSRMGRRGSLEARLVGQPEEALFSSRVRDEIKIKYLTSQ